MLQDSVCTMTYDISINSLPLLIKYSDICIPLFSHLPSITDSILKFMKLKSFNVAKIETNCVRGTKIKKRYFVDYNESNMKEFKVRPQSPFAKLRLT